MVTRRTKEQLLSEMLCALTSALQDVTGEGPYGVLGGEDGYGVEFSNDVFEMHPYSWDDCECGFDERADDWLDANRHADHCYQTDVKRAKVWDMLDDAVARDQTLKDLCAKYDIDPDEPGRMLHCTCDWRLRRTQWLETNDHDPTCCVVRPNFRHYATGFEARWYKRIGRGLEFVNVDAGVCALTDAIDSVTTGVDGERS